MYKKVSNRNKVLKLDVVGVGLTSHSICLVKVSKTNGVSLPMGSRADGKKANKSRSVVGVQRNGSNTTRWAFELLVKLWKHSVERVCNLLRLSQVWVGSDNRKYINLIIQIL